MKQREICGRSVTRHRRAVGGGRSGVPCRARRHRATLDGDGQNNPAFLPDLIRGDREWRERAGLAAGQRVGRKGHRLQETPVRVANGVRSAILRDGTRDTGCRLKAFGARCS